MNEDWTWRELKRRCQEAGMENPVKWIASKLPTLWDFLKGAFIREKIIPTDIDGIVEQNGYFLILENKEAEKLKDGNIPAGQLKTFQSLIRIPQFTVVFLGVDEYGMVVCMRYMKRSGELSECVFASEKEIYEKCRKWSEEKG